MNIREKMTALLQNNANYIDCGTYQIDGRIHGVLQDKTSLQLQVIYQSKDNHDEQGNHVIKSVTYVNLRELLEDFVLMMSVH